MGLPAFKPVVFTPRQRPVNVLHRHILAGRPITLTVRVDYVRRALAGCCRSTVMRLLASGELTGIRGPRGRILIFYESLVEYFQRHRL